MKKKWTARIWCVLLTAAMLFSLTGCGILESLTGNEEKTEERDRETKKSTKKATKKQTEDETAPGGQASSDYDPAGETQPGGPSDEGTASDEYGEWGDEDPFAPVKPYEAEVRPLDGGTRVKAGDIVTFGSYPQSSSGASAPIEWIVLDVRDGKALLLSRYILDAARYHGEYRNVTWAECDLRRWLNEEFLNAAFGGVKDRLAPSLSTADKTPELDSAGDPGADVTDKVFLLSALDVINPAYGFREDLNYGTQCPIRMARPTEYAVSRGVEPASAGPDEGNAEWWLRSTGANGGKNAVYIYFDSFVCTYGGYVIHNYGVRPSVWVTLK